MVESFHYIVDNTEGVFLSFTGQMQIDHGGFQLGVPQVALANTDINACFKEMGGILSGAGYGRKPSVF